MNGEDKPYRQMNETLRVEAVDPTEENIQTQFLSLFRSLDLLHVYWEYVLPSAREGNSITFAALRNRIWPPWGPNSLAIEAILHICPVGNDFVGIVGPFVSPQNLGNVGMMGALYKETLEDLQRQGKKGIRYFVRKGSALAHYTLTTAGFQQTDDLYLSEEGRYYTYEGKIEEVLRTLGLNDLSTAQLLAVCRREAPLPRL